MHRAAHLLARGRLWILKGFQREVIHNVDDIFTHRREGVHVAFNPVNGPLISNLSSHIFRHVHGSLLANSLRTSF